MHRVEELADKKRPEGFVPKGRPKYKNLVPLIEIIAESMNTQPISPKVVDEYKHLVNQMGTEMNILLKATRADIEREASTSRIAEGIEKVRAGDVVIEPGYDGVFGVVKIWPPKSQSAQTPPQTPKEPIIQAEGQVGIFD